MSASKSTLASDASTLSLWLKPEKRGIAISIAVLAILLTTFAYLIRQSPALPEAVKPSHIDKRETSQVNYGELVRNRLAIANRDAGIATKSFEAGLRKIILINWPNLITASNSAAETVGSYDAMCNTFAFKSFSMT